LRLKIISVYDIFGQVTCDLVRLEVLHLKTVPFVLKLSLCFLFCLLFRFFLDVIGDVFQLLVDLAFDICGLVDCCIRRFLGSTSCASACLVNLVH